MPPKCCVQVEHIVLAFDHFVKLPVHPSKLGHAQKAKFKTDSFWRKLRPPLNISLYFLRSCFFVGFVLFVLCCFFYFGLNDTVPLHKLGIKVVSAIRKLHNFSQ